MMFLLPDEFVILWFCVRLNQKTNNNKVIYFRYKEEENKLMKLFVVVVVFMVYDW